MLSFGHVERQDAILVAGLDFVSIDRGRQSKTLLILAGSKAAPVSGGVLGHLDVGRPLDAQGILLSSDLYVIGIDTRHRDLQDKPIRGLMQVRGNTAARKANARNKAILKQTIHCLPQGDHFIERVVTSNVSHKGTSSFEILSGTLASLLVEREDFSFLLLLT